MHTPEFSFEKNADNVRRAVQQMRIEYPLVLDSDYSIWRAFSNHYWPALYFIDAMKKEAAVLSGPSGRIACRFHARDVHLVMGPPPTGAAVRFRVSIDGTPPGSAHGGDADEGGNGVVTEPRLYQLVRQNGPIVDRQFEIEFQDSGLEAFAFTFG